MHPILRHARATVRKIQSAIAKQPEDNNAEAVRSIKNFVRMRLEKARRNFDTEYERPGNFAKAILWGGSHPVKFAALIGAVCTSFALLCLPAPHHDLAILGFPKLPSDYTHAAFVGTIWAVQATLIALVYPIVLTFVPILLQQRASSKFALAFYMRDSAVLPAGTSSLLLLLVLSAQYLGAYYFSRELFLFIATTNGLWLLANIGLTGYFLVKTVRYVEEDVGEETYRRLSLAYVLWSDLEEAQKAAQYISAGPNIGNHRSGSREPIVRTMAIRSGEPTIYKTVPGKSRLVDVNLLLVNRVAQAWAKRASSDMGATSDAGVAPTLELLPSFLGEYSGRVSIARVADGPELTAQERQDLVQAYRFSSPKRRIFKSTTKALLEELASEVQSQLDRGRFDEASQAFKKLVGLHEAFLNFSNTHQNSNLANSPAPWSGGYRSISEHWLDTYRPLLEATASKISANQILWRDLCRLPANLLRNANPQSTQISADILEQYELVDHFIGTWWTREARRSQSAFATSGAQLPEPTASDYRNAITAVVDGLNVAVVPYQKAGDGDEKRWQAHVRATVTWSAHADVCARLLIRAVRRGDRVAAEWYSDCLVHWLSDRSYEYGSRGFVDTQSKNLLNIQELGASWAEAKIKVSASLRRDATLDDAVHTLWKILVRHWIIARFTSALLLLRNDVHGIFQELAYDIVGHILSLQFFNPGPSADAQSLLDQDQLLTIYLDICCLDTSAYRQFSSLSNHILRRGNDGPLISGWAYTIRGSHGNPEAHAQVFMTLLLASTGAGRLSLGGTYNLFGKHRDLKSMPALARILSLLGEEIQQSRRREIASAAAALRAAAGLPVRQVSPLLFWRRTLKRMLQDFNARIDEERSKIIVPPEAVATLVTRLEAELLSPTDGKAWNGHVRTAIGVVSISEAVWFERPILYEKAAFLRPSEEEFSQKHLQQWARRIARETLDVALEESLRIKAVKPVEGATDRDRMLNVAAAIRVEQWSGRLPVVLAPYGSTGQIVEEIYWQVEGRSGPPYGVEFTTRQDLHGPFAPRMICGARIHYMKNLKDQIYVVPDSWFDCLVFNRTRSGVALLHEFHIHGANNMQLQLNWQAELPGAFVPV